MKIAITGASGYLGNKLVPILAAQNAKLLLIGRDVEKIKTIFPNYEASSYADFFGQVDDFDIIVHAATINNDSNLSYEKFKAANVILGRDIIDSMSPSKGTLFLNVTTSHVFNENKKDFYALTKREFYDIVNDINDKRRVNLVLPFIYDEDSISRISVMKYIPSFISGMAFNIIKSFYAASHVDRVADAILNINKYSIDGDIFISDGQEGNKFYLFIKRFVDISFSIAIIILFWWLLLIIAVIVKLDSSGPALFAQERVGRNGRPFVCYKFRTMKLGTVQAETSKVSSAHVTKIGSILRSLKLDELPQVWNLLKNEMSLVGPRPSLTIQHELIELRRSMGVLSINPGITGLAQVNGIDMSDPARLAAWDYRYLKFRSILMDLKIAIRTFLGGGSGDKTNSATSTGA